MKLFPSLRAQIQVAKTKMKLAIYFKFEASVEIISDPKLWLTYKYHQNTPKKDMKDILFVPKYVSLKIRKKTFNF